MSGTLHRKKYESLPEYNRAKRLVMKPKYRMQVEGASKGKGAYKRERFKLEDYT